MATKITENQAATVCGGGVNLRFVMQVLFQNWKKIYNLRKVINCLKNFFFPVGSATKTQF